MIDRVNSYQAYQLDIRVGLEPDSRMCRSQRQVRLNLNLQYINEFCPLSKLFLSSLLSAYFARYLV